MPETHQDVLEVLDNTYTFAFVLELICKMIGLGPALFFRDPFNILDLIIVLCSVTDMILFNTILSKYDNSVVVRSIISFRLMRVLRLARIWKQF